MHGWKLYKPDDQGAYCWSNQLISKLQLKSFPVSALCVMLFYNGYLNSDVIEVERENSLLGKRGAKYNGKVEISESLKLSSYRDFIA